MLVHADLHNHTVASDGDGSPEAAFASMREAGLDVAALTDHATLFAIDGLSSSEWRTTGDLANAANDPGQFTAIRGFEWSHPLQGHINVWNTSDFADLWRAGSTGSLYRWLIGRPGGLASFNHPGREPAGSTTSRSTPRPATNWWGWRCSTAPTTTCSRVGRPG